MSGLREWLSGFLPLEIRELKRLSSNAATPSSAALSTAGLSNGSVKLAQKIIQPENLTEILKTYAMHECTGLAHIGLLNKGGLDCWAIDGVGFLRGFHPFTATLNNTLIISPPRMWFWNREHAKHSFASIKCS
jgi:hypothetical protein